MFSLLNWLQDDLELYEGLWSSKISFIISGAISILNLQWFLLNIRPFKYSQHLRRPTNHLQILKQFNGVTSQTFTLLLKVNYSKKTNMKENI